MTTTLPIFLICARIAVMTTATLQQAFENLGTLPADLQDELGNQLKHYATQWHALKADIEEGRAQLARGEKEEIADIDAYVTKIMKGHGQAT